MHPLLEQDHNHIDQLLQYTQALASHYFQEQHSLSPGRHVPDITLENLPEKGVGGLRTLERFAREYSGGITNSAGPRYFGFVTGGTTPAALAGDWLVSTYDQNADGSNDSIAPQLERQTIHFFKQIFGLDDAYFGSFVTGATVANFVGLTLGRQWLGEQHGVDVSQDGLAGLPPIRLVSGTPHASIIKALSMTGMGRNAVVKIDTLPDREAVDVQALERYLMANKEPVIIVANAGTVNTVDFDDLTAIGELKKRYNFWLHVDAAFGGFAACSNDYAHYMNGINHADSVTIDAHKWLNVPYDAAMQFTRHKKLQLKVFQNSAVYLGDPESSPDYLHYTPENSRRFRALPAWFTLVAYGKEGHREIVERNCAAAKQLGALLEQSDAFRVLAPVRMNVVCFTLAGKAHSLDEVQQFLNAVRDDGQVFFTPTVYKGVPAIRAAVSNWLTGPEDIVVALASLTKIAARAATEKV